MNNRVDLNVVEAFVKYNKICEGCGMSITREVHLCPFCKSYRFEENDQVLREFAMDKDAVLATQARMNELVELFNIKF